VLRACIVNFRTQQKDIDTLIDTVLEIGARLAPRVIESY
jgi:hypothetical protein